MSSPPKEYYTSYGIGGAGNMRRASETSSIRDVIAAATAKATGGKASASEIEQALVRERSRQASVISDKSKSESTVGLLDAFKGVFSRKGGDSSTS